MKKDVKYGLLVIILTIGLWIFREVVGFVNKYIGFLDQLYILALCVGTAMYLAKKL